MRVTLRRVPVLSDRRHHHAGEAHVTEPVGHDAQAQGEALEGGAWAAEEVGEGDDVGGHR